MRRVLPQASPGDPWDDFAGFLRTCSEKNLSDRALAQVMTTQPAEIFREAAEETGLVAVGAQLLDRAQRQGTAREDATVTDIPVVMCGLAAVLESWGEDAGRRYMTLVLDGLRAAAPERRLTKPLHPAVHTDRASETGGQATVGSLPPNGLDSPFRGWRSAAATAAGGPLGRLARPVHSTSRRRPAAQRRAEPG